MKISEVIGTLELLKDKIGDAELHLEVGEEEVCDGCGGPKYINFSGQCESVGTISVDGKKCAYLLATRG